MHSLEPGHVVLLGGLVLLLGWSPTGVPLYVLQIFGQLLEMCNWQTSVVKGPFSLANCKQTLNTYNELYT